MNIDEICNNLLDNSDVVLDFSNYPKVVLNFIVAGTVCSKYWEVQFILDSVFQLSLATEMDVEATAFDSYIVLGATVKSKVYGDVEVYEVTLESGDFEFYAKTVNFNYSATSYEFSEFSKKYPYIFR